MRCFSPHLPAGGRRCRPAWGCATWFCYGPGTHPDSFRLPAGAAGNLPGSDERRTNRHCCRPPRYRGRLRLSGRDCWGPAVCPRPPSDAGSICPPRPNRCPAGSGGGPCSDPHGPSSRIRPGTCLPAPRLPRQARPTKTGSWMISPSPNSFRSSCSKKLLTAPPLSSVSVPAVAPASAIPAHPWRGPG